MKITVTLVGCPACGCVCVACDCTERAKREAQLLAASRNALTVLTDLAESAAYWSDYDVPVGLVPRVDEARARLAAALEGGQR